MTSSNNSALYVGVTSDLVKRVWEHKNRIGSKFTSKYHLTRLVYYEISDEIQSAIAREKQLKAGARKKKLDLINKTNPDWRDLYDDIVG